MRITRIACRCLGAGLLVRMLLDGRKAYLIKDQIVPVVHLEHFEELTVANMIIYARENVPQALNYLPDDLTPSKQDRHFGATVDYSGDLDHL